MNNWQQFTNTLHHCPHNHSLTYRTSIADDLERIIAHDCLIDMSHLGVLYVAGKDAAQFLQGQLTCNMKLVTTTQAQAGAYCNAQGRVIATFIAIAWQDGILLLMPREIISNTLAILSKYAIFSKVTLSDSSDSVVLLGLQGNISNTPLTLPLDNYKTVSSTLTTTIKLPGSRYVLIAHPDWMNENWQPLTNHWSIVGSVAWHYLQMQQGFPNIYLATQEKLLPHRINLPQLDAINFNKGCYIGQEIIARTHFKATLKHGMYLYRTTGERLLSPGNIVNTADGKQKVGEIVDWCYAPNQQQLILAIMLIEYHQLSDCMIEDQKLLITLHLECNIF